MAMGLLAVIGLVAVGLWLGLTMWFAGMLVRPESPPLRRLGAKALAGLAAAVVVVGLATAGVAALCSGMRF